jgi:hypothetical protein
VFIVHKLEGVRREEKETWVWMHVYHAQASVNDLLSHLVRARTFRNKLCVHYHWLSGKYAIDQRDTHTHGPNLSLCLCPSSYSVAFPRHVYDGGLLFTASGLHRGAAA